MQKMTINELGHDGMRRIKFVGDKDLTPPRPSPNDEKKEHHLGREIMCLVPCEARERVVISSKHDEMLDLYSSELTYPVYEPFGFSI